MKEQVLYSEILRHLREEEYFSILSDLVSYNRVQGTPEMLEAMHFLEDILQSAEIDTELFEKVMQERDSFYGFPYFRGYRLYSSKAVIEWNKKRIELDFDTEPHAFIQRSKKQRGRFRVVLPDDKRIKGNFVLIDNFSRGRYDYLYGRGASGIVVFDRKAPESARKKAQFWYYSNNEEPMSGVVLTGKEWKEVESAVKSGDRVFIDIDINSEFISSSNVYLLGKIQGDRDEGILYVAHTCHLKGEANDNGSGASSLVYAAYIMQKLIDKGVLKKPPYTLYFLLVPEMWGTGLFIERHREVIDEVFAGLNFDMVGSDLIKTGGRVYIEDVHGSIRSNISGIYKKHLLLLHDFLDFPFAVYTRPFEGGSDHLLFQDLDFQLPMPMLIHWPDRYYHTDLDVISNINVKAIWRNIILMISLPYTLNRRNVKFYRKKFEKKGRGRVFVKKKRGVFIPTLDKRLDIRMNWYKLLENKKGYVNFMQFFYYIDGVRGMDDILDAIQRDSGKRPDRAIYEKYMEYLVENGVIETA